MNAKKSLRIDAALQGIHRLAQEVRLRTDVQAQVVAGGLDPVNLFHLEEENTSARLDDQPLQMLAPRPDVAQEGEQLLARLGALIAADVGLGSFEGPGKAVAIEGFQQVVEGLHLEGTQGVAVVGRDEN